MISDLSQSRPSGQDEDALDNSQFLNYVEGSELDNIRQALSVTDDVAVIKNLLLAHDSKDNAALHLAILQEDTEIVKVILAKLFSLRDEELLKSVLNAVNKDGYSVLRYLAINKELFEELVKQAKEAGNLKFIFLCQGIENRTVLHFAIYDESTEVVDLIRDTIKAEKLERDVLLAKDIYGNTPSHFAVDNGDKTLANDLLSVDDVNLESDLLSASNNKGNTAAHAAMIDEKYDVAQVYYERILSKSKFLNVLSATNTDGYSLLRYIVFGSTEFQTSCLTKAREAQTINALIAIKVDAKTLYQFAQEEEDQEFVGVLADLMKPVIAGTINIRPDKNRNGTIDLAQYITNTSELTFTATNSANYSVAFEGTTMIVTPIHNYVGADNITITLMDQNSLSSTAIGYLNVIAVDYSPVITLLSHDISTNDKRVAVIDFSVNDEDGPENKKVVLTAACSYGSAIVSGLSLEYTAISTHVGPAQCNVTATDDTNRTDMVTVDIDVKYTCPGFDKDQFAGEVYWYNQELGYGVAAKTALQEVATAPQASWEKVFKQAPKSAPCRIDKNKYCTSGITSKKEQRDVEKIKKVINTFILENTHFTAEAKAAILSKVDGNTECSISAIKEWCSKSTNSDAKYELLCGTDSAEIAVDQHVKDLVGVMFADNSQ